MEFKAFELLALSGVIGQKCESDIKQYETCLQAHGVGNPACEAQVNQSYKCIRRHFKIEPLCMKSFNQTRECFFKSDGALLPCYKFKRELEHCMKEPGKYVEFLRASTEFQKKPISFDFEKFPGSLTSNT